MAGLAWCRGQRRCRRVAWLAGAAGCLVWRLSWLAGNRGAYVPPAGLTRTGDGGRGGGRGTRRGSDAGATALRAGRRRVGRSSSLSPTGSASAVDDDNAGLAYNLLALLAALGFAEVTLPSVISLIPASGGFAFLGNSLVQNFSSVPEDLFLATLVLVTLYCLVEMAGMQMKCPHWEARLHTSCNALAIVLSLYGLLTERVLRESPDVWWAVLTPLLYGVSNFTMSGLMKMYKGPQAYLRMFELGQSFTLSFQGIHLLAWSSMFPWLYWAAMPFWYWSLKKLLETVSSIVGAATSEDAGHVENHLQRNRAWGAFGLQLDAFTVIFLAINFAAALIDNTYMAVFTARGPDGFFEVSKGLSDVSAAGGWGSDHLRTALVKPALGSLTVSVGVFLGTLCSRKRLPLAAGVPVAALLTAVGPWVVFFWHRLIDPSEPWFPEFIGSNWGAGPLMQLMLGGS